MGSFCEAATVDGELNDHQLNHPPTSKSAVVPRSAQETRETRGSRPRGGTETPNWVRFANLLLLVIL
jgi:hypothetical protein